ncbi:MAG: metallophosphoesterase [Moraxellaceae bacterium]|nr:MAG: metallophosphoesterase [Moraxellaceae bacterium]
MKVYALSDIHVDYKENKRWLFSLSNPEYRNDVLILAGDLTDDLELLEECFHFLAETFKQVLYVPGNHELWVKRNPGITSMEKVGLIGDLAAKCSISTEVFHIGSLSIVPLLSWYDFSFGEPNEKLTQNWVDFRACKWPAGMDELALTQHFLKQNTQLEITNETVISFSHFMPRIDLMPSYIPEAFHYLHPVMGSELLEEQIRQLKPQIHVYGHSHVNRQITLDGIEYVNNAFGYPSETRITRKELLCIYEG